MKYRNLYFHPTMLGVFAAILFIGFLTLAVSRRTHLRDDRNQKPATTKESMLQTAFGNLPLSFEPNRGQTNDPVKFLARGGGSALYLTGTEAVLSYREGRTPIAEAKNSERTLGTARSLRMRMIGATSQPKASGQDDLPGKANYFIGRDSKKWLRDLPTYSRVKFEGVYPGVDMVYYGSQGRQLEYDFIVAPGADPDRIRIGFEGADRLEIDSKGDLALSLNESSLRMQKPVVYQDIEGVRREIPAQYQLTKQGEIAFTLGAYDRSQPLVIDPILAYSTFLGGSGQDGGVEIAVTDHGNAIVTGYTNSVDFPVSSSTSTPAGGVDAFVTKLSVDGTKVLFSAYLGGSGVENFHGDLSAPGVAYAGVALDPNDNIYLTGITHSADFPVTPGVYQTQLKGPADAYVVKLNAFGNQLVYSTYLGGAGFDGAQAIAVDNWGHAYITGQDESGELPVTGFASHSTGCSSGYKDGYVVKLNAIGTVLLYSSYFGGNGCNLGWGIAIDNFHNAYVMGETVSTDFPTTPGAFDSTCGADGACGGGSDLFVAKVNTDNSGKASFSYGTYLGGSGEERVVYNGGIAVDGAGQFVYVTGLTSSVNPADFPLKKPAQSAPNGPSDAFITKLDPAKSGQDQLVYSTYLGGGGDDIGRGIAIDIDGAAYVAGGTGGTFPTTAGEATCADPGVFAVKLSAVGGVAYSTCLSGLGGDSALDVAVDPAGNAYLTGVTESYNFPIKNAFQASFGGGAGIAPSDGFVVKLSNGLDHFKCYDVKPEDPFQPFSVLLRDEFENETVNVIKPVSLCNPVAKCIDDGNPRTQLECNPPMNRTDQLVCYETSDDLNGSKFAQRGVVVSNQFGKQQRLFAYKRQNLLCLPSLGRLAGDDR